MDLKGQRRSSNVVDTHSLADLMANPDVQWSHERMRPSMPAAQALDQEADALDRGDIQPLQAHELNDTKIGDLLTALQKTIIESRLKARYSERNRMTMSAIANEENDGVPPPRSDWNTPPEPLGFERFPPRIIPGYDRRFSVQTNLTHNASSFPSQSKGNGIKVTRKSTPLPPPTKPAQPLTQDYGFQ